MLPRKLLLWIFLFLLIGILIVALNYSCRRHIDWFSLDPAQRYNLTSIIGYTPPKGYYPYNPSIWYDNTRGRIYLSIRLSNKGCGKEPLKREGVVNKLMMAYVDPITFKAQHIAEIDSFPLNQSLDPKGFGCDNIGIEDLRLWTHGNNLYGIGTYVGNTTPNWNSIDKEISLPTCKNRVAIVKFDPDKLTITSVIPVEYGDGGNEKNWIPIDQNSSSRPSRAQLFVYSWDPFIVISWSEGKMIEWKRESVDNMISRKVSGATNLKGVRGSSQVVYWAKNDVYLTTVHTRDLAGKSYRHFMVQLDSNLNVIAVSESFCINSGSSDPTLCGIEFISGISITPDDNVVVTYGVGDCSANLTTIDMENI